MKKSIVAVMAILVLLVSLLCACKKDDTKTNADTTGEAQTSAAGDVVDDTTVLPEDSTAQEGETNETQSTDPAKPGETSAQVTAAPSKNAKDWTKAEIIAYFNTGANRVKYQAKSVTRNYTETKNDAGKTELPKAIDAIGKSAMKTFMKRDDKALVMTSKEDIKTVFPVGGKDWVSKLTPADVEGAKVEDKGGEYQITLTFGTEVNPSGEKGYAAAFGVLTADVVNFDYPGLSLTDQKFTYYNGTIVARFSKSTGNLVYAHYDYPVIIELTAHLLGSNTRVKVGMTTINDFTIKY
mgnify:CR=1 FL=1